MRNCSELLDNLAQNYKEVYSFITEKANEKKDFFIGIRYNYLNIYYKCASVVRISTVRKKPVFITHVKYLGKDDSGLTGDKKYERIGLDELKANWSNMLKKIDIIQLGDPNTKETKSSHKRIEKVCQQWIVNEANSRKESDWYYVDLEYTMQGVPTGRFDMIAVSKDIIDGKHRVALIELKVKDKSYAGMDGTKAAKYEKELETIKNVKDGLYGFEKVKLGSGIVGHITDYLRFLQKNHYKTLKQEIVNIIECHNKLGLLNNPELSCISRITSVDDLAEKPEVHIVSYTEGLNNGQTNDNAVTIRKLKKSMYKYLFEEPIKDKGIGKTSEYCLERLINPGNIEGFYNLKKDLFNDDNNIKCSQPIQTVNGNTSFDFDFTFVEASSDDAWNCLP